MGKYISNVNKLLQVPNTSIERGNVMFLIFVLFCGLYLYNALITFYNRQNGIVLWKTTAWLNSQSTPSRGGLTTVQACVARSDDSVCRTREFDQWGTRKPSGVI